MSYRGSFLFFHFLLKNAKSFQHCKSSSQCFREHWLFFYLFYFANKSLKILPPIEFRLRFVEQLRLDWLAYDKSFL